MNLDGLLINKYIQNIKAFLPLKINKIQQIRENEFLFQVRGNKQNQQLFVSMDTQSYRVHFSKKSFNTSFEPTSFLMVLRKYLTQAIITDIQQPTLDRIVIFEIETLNNLKDKIKLYLHLEFFGKYTNMILVNQDNKIIDCFKRNHAIENRLLFPQAMFTPTFNNEKYSLFDTQSKEINEYNGFSKVIRNELVFIDLQKLLKYLNESETIYYYPKQDVFHFLPLTHLNESYIEYPLFDALEQIYFEKENIKRINDVSGNIQKYVKKELSKAELKLQKLQQTLNSAHNYETYQYYGDLLFANAYQFKHHLNEIELEDFEGKQVVIPLDIKFDLKENAKRYYKKYTKSKTAIKMIQIQIEKTQESIQYYKLLQSQLEFAKVADALEIAEELNLTTKKNIKAKKQKSPNFLKLKYNNVEIYVGKNNIQNDYITNKISKKHYLWFHVKDFHGSHVVVNQSEVNEDVLRLCATLAAYFSKARYSSSIPVNYCLLKQLKATRGNHVGMVYLGNYKTIYIDIEEKQLLETIEKYQVNEK